jgi:hypothetical protein
MNKKSDLRFSINKFIDIEFLINLVISMLMVLIIEALASLFFYLCALVNLEIPLRTKELIYVAPFGLFVLYIFIFIFMRILKDFSNLFIKNSNSKNSKY